jgi:hypothetical protein
VRFDPAWIYLFDPGSGRTAAQALGSQQMGRA